MASLCRMSSLCGLCNAGCCYAQRTKELLHHAMKSIDLDVYKAIVANQEPRLAAVAHQPFDAAGGQRQGAGVEVAGKLVVSARRLAARGCRTSAPDRHRPACSGCAKSGRGAWAKHRPHAARQCANEARQPRSRATRRIVTQAVAQAPRRIALQCIPSRPVAPRAEGDAPNPR